MLGAAGALTDDGLNDGRTTTDDDDDDDGRRRTVSVFQLFTPQNLVVQKRYFFPGILSMRSIFPDGFQAFRSFI